MFLGLDGAHEPCSAIVLLSSRDVFCLSEWPSIGDEWLVVDRGITSFCASEALERDESEDIRVLAKDAKKLVKLESEV